MYQLVSADIFYRDMAQIAGISFSLLRIRTLQAFATLDTLHVRQKIVLIKENPF